MFVQVIDSMQSIKVVHIPANIEPDYLNFFLANVSEKKRQQFPRFIHQEDAYLSLLGEVLIRSTLSTTMEVNHRELKFDYNPYGKPLLHNNPDITFNISHSGNWVAMISDNEGHSVGIDVEKMVPLNLAFASNLFAPQENQVLASTTGDAKLAYFYQLWTLKESYMKAIGKGFSIPLTSFSMNCRDDTGEWYSPEAKEFHFKSFRMDQAHILSVCSNVNSLPDIIQYVSLSDLYDSLR